MDEVARLLDVSSVLVPGAFDALEAPGSPLLLEVLPEAKFSVLGLTGLLALEVTPSASTCTRFKEIFRLRCPRRSLKLSFLKNSRGKGCIIKLLILHDSQFVQSLIL